MQKYIITLIIFISTLTSSKGQDMSLYQAIYITKFIDYVEWPSKNNQLTVGVMGNPEVVNKLNTLFTKKGKDYTAQDIRLSADVTQYNIIYVAESNTADFPQIRSQIEGKSILLITENDKLVNDGACISFYEDASKLKFMINKSTFDQNNLKVSSNLLSLAKVM